MHEDDGLPARNWLKATKGDATHAEVYDDAGPHDHRLILAPLRALVSVLFATHLLGRRGPAASAKTFSAAEQRAVRVVEGGPVK